jgi:hypothetical protein
MNFSHFYYLRPPLCSEKSNRRRESLLLEQDKQIIEQKLKNGKPTAQGRPFAIIDRIKRSGF